MKASELIEKLQSEIQYHGDHGVKGSCDHLGEDSDGMFDIGEIGWLVDQEGEHYYTLICAECAYMHHLEHLEGKYGFEE